MASGGCSCSVEAVKFHFLGFIFYRMLIDDSQQFVKPAYMILKGGEWAEGELAKTWRKISMCFNEFSCSDRCDWSHSWVENKYICHAWKNSLDYRRVLAKERKRILSVISHRLWCYRLSLLFTRQKKKNNQPKKSLHVEVLIEKPNRR